MAQQTHDLAAKAAVLGFSCRLARGAGKQGITVNVVAPGLKLTPAAAKPMPAEMIEAQIQARAIERNEKSEDLAGAIFFLASPVADFMSGQIPDVEQGKTHALSEQQRTI
jgi:3-oxoacyl-[acyl-carrier protein] reductase